MKMVTGGTVVSDWSELEHWRRLHCSRATLKKAKQCLSHLNQTLQCHQSLDELNDLNDYDAVINAAGEPNLLQTNAGVIEQERIL